MKELFYHHKRRVRKSAQAFPLDKQEKENLAEKWQL
jgi:hypothetical protein